MIKELQIILKRPMEGDPVNMGNDDYFIDEFIASGKFMSIGYKAKDEKGEWTGTWISINADASDDDIIRNIMDLAMLAFDEEGKDET